MYWQPPKSALEKVQELVWEPSVSRYGADEGLPELREALTKKVKILNYITYSIMPFIFTSCCNCSCVKKIIYANLR